MSLRQNQVAEPSVGSLPFFTVMSFQTLPNSIFDTRSNNIFHTQHEKKLGLLLCASINTASSAAPQIPL